MTSVACDASDVRIGRITASGVQRRAVDCADYFVASEETIPGDGFRYAYILKQFSTQNYDPLSFAKLMVSAYNTEYAGTSNYTFIESTYGRHADQHA